MSHLNFCNPIKVDMSGNTDWPQASGFQKTRQIAQFLAFLTNFCPLKFLQRRTMFENNRKSLI